jgi:hypothetical protein
LTPGYSADKPGFSNGVSGWSAQPIRYVNLGEGKTRVVVRLEARHREETALPDLHSSALSSYWPIFEPTMGTGETIIEIGRSLREIWGRRFSATPAVDVSTALFDVAAGLQSARSQAGLPVQDLAAMFGIKRRQFYNLLSNEQETEPDRVPRIARVTDAIAKVSSWVGGNSRNVRALLLARLDGDSIYDAAVAGDEARIASAIERAYSAAAQGSSLAHRVVPSNRATPFEAAAIREYLRSTRDESSGTNEP